MPLPTMRDVLPIDPLLTTLSIGWALKPETVTASRLAPVVSTKHQSGTVVTYEKGDFFRIDVKSRAPGTKFARTSFGTGSTTFTCALEGLEHPVADEIADNALQPIDVDKTAVQVLGQKFLLKRAKSVVDTFFTTGVWGRDLAGQSGHVAESSTTAFAYWNEPAANIIGVLRTQCNYIQSQTGLRPNVFACSRSVFDVMERDAEIQERFKYTSGSSGVLSTKAIAALCGIGSAGDPGDIHIIDTPHNTAAEGATTSMSFMLGDSALLAYINPTPKLDEPTALACLSWSPYDPNAASVGAPTITSYRDESIKSTIYRGESAYTMKSFATECAVYFGDILA